MKVKEKTCTILGAGTESRDFSAQVRPLQQVAVRGRRGDLERAGCLPEASLLLTACPRSPSSSTVRPAGRTPASAEIPALEVQGGGDESSTSQRAETWVPEASGLCFPQYLLVLG